MKRIFVALTLAALFFGGLAAPSAHASWGDGSDESGSSSLFDTWCPQ